MKVIIAGPRDIDDYEAVLTAIEASGFTITEVVSGCANGIDTLGEHWAKANGIPVKPFPANWDEHGMDAGPIRNQEMVDYVSPEGAAIFIWNGYSTGTWDCIKRAKKAGIQHYLHRI